MFRPDSTPLTQLEYIEHLEDRLVRLEAERDEYQSDWLSASKTVVDYELEIDKLREVLKTLLDTWELAEDNRGCYSCHNPHDCRCPAILYDPPGECVCYREDLEAAADQAREVLGGGE